MYPEIYTEKGLKEGTEACPYCLFDCLCKPIGNKRQKINNKFNRRLRENLEIALYNDNDMDVLVTDLKSFDPKLKSIITKTVHVREETTSANLGKNGEWAVGNCLVNPNLFDKIVIVEMKKVGNQKLRDFTYLLLFLMKDFSKLKMKCSCNITTDDKYSSVDECII